MNFKLRFLVYGAPITFQEAHVLALSLGRSMRKMKSQKMPTENTSGECTTEPTHIITLMGSMLRSPIGCVTSTRRILAKVKIWLHVKSSKKFISTPSSQFCPIKNC